MDNIGIYINLNRTKKKIIVKSNDTIETIKPIIKKMLDLNNPFSITHNNRIIYSKNKVYFKNNDNLDINININGGLIR